MPNIISKILHRKSKSSSSAGTSPSPASKSTPNLSRSTPTPSQSPTTPTKSRQTPSATLNSSSVRNLVDSPQLDVAAAQSKDLPDIPSFAAVQASSKNQQLLNQSPNSSRVLPTKSSSPVGQDEGDVVVIDKSSDPHMPEETSLETRPLDEMVGKTSGQIIPSREDGGAFGGGHQTESSDPHSSTEDSTEAQRHDALSVKSLNQPLQPVDNGGDLKRGKTTRSLQGVENTQKISEFPSPPERPENISHLNGDNANQDLSYLADLVSTGETTATQDGINDKFSTLTINSRQPQAHPEYDFPRAPSAAGSSTGTSTYATAFSTPMADAVSLAPSDTTARAVEGASLERGVTPIRMAAAPNAITAIPTTDALARNTTSANSTSVPTTTTSATPADNAIIPASEQEKEGRNLDVLEQHRAELNDKIDAGRSARAKERQPLTKEGYEVFEKAGMKDLVGKADTIETNTRWLEPVVQEHIRPQVHTEYATNIDREIHVYHEYPRILPVEDPNPIIQPTKHRIFSAVDNKWHEVDEATAREVLVDDVFENGPKEVREKRYSLLPGLGEMRKEDQDKWKLVNGQWVEITGVKEPFKGRPGGEQEDENGFLWGQGNGKVWEREYTLGETVSDWKEIAKEKLGLEHKSTESTKEVQTDPVPRSASQSVGLAL
ncbi:hypothetical protein C367_03649 [Cryptococcus neoformans Ze90-1]|nr:hypothetical protein C367_03649 [Cryptococcus neoformans var. grubii Ze90-1]